MSNLSKILKDENYDNWRIANFDHPFVQELGNGSLPLDKFQYYLKQDYVFLINYCKVLAIASSKSSTEGMMKKWVSLLDETLNSEMDLHRNFCSEFGIPLSQLEKTVADSSTNNYCNFLIHLGDLIQIIYIADRVLLVPAYNRNRWLVSIIHRLWALLPYLNALWH